MANWCYPGGHCSLELLVEARLGFTSVLISLHSNMLISLDLRTMSTLALTQNFC